MPSKCWILLALLATAALAERTRSARQLFLECQRTVESADRLHVEFTTWRQDRGKLPVAPQTGTLWLDGPRVRLQSGKGALWIFDGRRSWKSSGAPEIEGYRSTPGRLRHLLVTHGVLALLRPTGGEELAGPTGFGRVQTEKGDFQVDLLLRYGRGTVRDTLSIDGTTHLPRRRTIYGSPTLNAAAPPRGDWCENFDRCEIPDTVDRHLFDIPPAR